MTTPSGSQNPAGRASIPFETHTPVRIVPYAPSLGPAFTAVNRAWIERLFTLEPADLKVLHDPQAAIIDPGG